MEYTLTHYKQNRGLIYRTSEGHKYLVSRRKGNQIYFKCVLFRSSCKSTAKLSQESNLIILLANHNHETDNYNDHIYLMKAKCKEAAKSSGENLRKIFNDVTRRDPKGRTITFVKCESLMYRARRQLQPKIPQTSFELESTLQGTPYGLFLKDCVTVGDNQAFIFFSDETMTILAEISDISFDGTFYTVPKQFYQLWTIFIVVNQHVIPAIHYLLTGKSQELYEAILFRIKSIVPRFNPQIAMSDWEIAPRNAFKTAYNGIKLQGCWFHYTQRICKMVQKCNLVNAYNNNTAFKNFLRNIMALPFLPPDTIQPIFIEITIPDLNLSDNQVVDFGKLKRYLQRRWIYQVSSEELSIWHHGISTNNGAESYHGRLKSSIKCKQPRIWNFLETLNEIIIDMDNELARLKDGLPITRARKKKCLINDEHRSKCKEKLIEGSYSPLEYIREISHTVGSLTEISIFDENSDEDEDEDGEITHTDTAENSNSNLCVVCLRVRETTWIFMPCKHESCCRDCSTRIEELGQTCPICRSTIQNRFEIFIN